VQHLEFTSASWKKAWELRAYGEKPCSSQLGAMQIGSTRCNCSSRKWPNPRPLFSNPAASFQYPCHFYQPKASTTCRTHTQIPALFFYFVISQTNKHQRDQIEASYYHSLWIPQVDKQSQLQFSIHGEPSHKSIGNPLNNC